MIWLRLVLKSDTLIPPPQPFSPPPSTTGPTQVILFQNGCHDWREKNSTPGTSTNFFFSGFQLSQPRVRIINMCIEVRHAAALSTQSLYALSQGIGQWHRVCHYRPQGTPEICTQKNMLRWLGVSGCGALGSPRLAPHTQRLLNKKNKGRHFSSFFLRSSSHIHPHSRAANMFRWWTCKLQCILQVSVSDLPGPAVSASPYPVLTTNYP